MLQVAYVSCCFKNAVLTSKARRNPLPIDYIFLSLAKSKRENTMNTVSKLLAAFVLVGSFFLSSNANAQATPTFSGAYPLAIIDVDVVRVFTRPPDVNGVYPFYFVLSAPFAATGSNSLPCLNPSNAADNNGWAVIHSNRADHKVIRETFQLAYALNKRVRVYTSQCVNLQPATQFYVYPVVWAVETL
jgi:hypothetical protein